MSLFNTEERDRISAAIEAAETTTSGEIVAVVTEQSNTYYYVPFMWAALVALVVPWPLIHYTWIPVQTIYIVQLLVFLALLILFWQPALRMALVPRGVRKANAHRRAVEQFLVQNLHTTAGRTGVLIFVSVAERYAEILADTGIDARVPPGTWQSIIDRLTSEIGDGRPADGFVHAIETCGQHLATHFPPGTGDPNELPNHLIVLDT